MDRWRQAIDLGARLGLFTAGVACLAWERLRRAKPEEVTAEAVASWVRRSPAEMNDLFALAPIVPADTPTERLHETILSRGGGNSALARALLGDCSTPPTSLLPTTETPAAKLGTAEAETPEAKTPSAPPRPNIPRRLGPYLLLEELGHGGMGIVYRASHERLGTQCAVKVLIAGEHASPEALARFAREAAAVAKLGKHPNIVTVHDLGQEGPITYYSMDLVAGKGLRDCVDSHPYSFEETVVLIERVARALHFAHQRGVIHRDVKPENILIDGAGEPQVLDFGLARDFQASEALTGSGDILGTLIYMAPEQVRGDVALTDARTDVYALGVILYEMLVSTRPFPERSAAILVSAKLQGKVVTPRSFRPDLPEALEIICLKCLDRDPSLRYATAGALAEDLERWRRHEPILADARRLLPPAPSKDATSKDFEGQWRILSQTPERLIDIVEEIKEGLRSIDIALAAIDGAEHVVRELVDNALEHGCRGREDGHADILISATPRHFKCTVEDDGPGFDHVAVIAQEEELAQSSVLASQPPTDGGWIRQIADRLRRGRRQAPATSPSAGPAESRRGRGLLLVKRLVDSLKFNSTGNKAMAFLRLDECRFSIARDTLRSDRGVGRLRVEGNLDAHTFEKVEGAINDIIDGGRVQAIVIDLSLCTYLSSAGVGVLIGAVGILQERGGGLIIVCNPAVRRVLNALGLSSVLQCVDRQEDADALLGRLLG